MRVTPNATRCRSARARVGSAWSALRAAVLLVAVTSSVRAAPAPRFDDPVALVAWLLQRSGHGFDPLDDSASAPVFSPGLRAAVQASMARSRRLNDPPCGVAGDFIRDTQEDGTPQHVRLSAQATAADRRTVAASYDVDGYHRERRFMVVLLDGAWKLENVVEPSGASLRRALECRR